MTDNTKDDGDFAPFDPMECYLNEHMAPDPWQLLSDEERTALASLARRRLGFETLEERGRDGLDFHEVSVLSLIHI